MNPLCPFAAFILTVVIASGNSADPLPLLPVPPMQAAPWSLAEGLADPDGTVKAVMDSLFGLGLADPRGCSYRHVKVREDGVLADGRGWVLPDSHNVIGWNGLIYLVEEIGDEADLAADVEILKQKGELQKEPFSNYGNESLDRLLNQFGATPRMMRSWAAPYLLLRLGHRVVIAGAPADPFSDTPFDYGKDGQLTFPAWHFEDARYWLTDFGLLIRAHGVAAFIDKNDSVAASRLPMFDRVWAEVEKRLPHLEGEKEVNPSEDGVSPPTRPRLNSTWRSVLVDARRRMNPTVATELPEIERNIARWDLLETWDEEDSPEVFDKVVAAGPAAIDPLLDCLKIDTRWTRIRKQTANTDPAELMPVREFAIIALERILRFPVVEIPMKREPTDDAWYGEAAVKMRAFCTKYDHACGGELWFRVLRDDSADLDLQWKAAKRIVRPDGVEDNYPKVFFPPGAYERFNDPQPSSEGKLLRGRHDPSVLDLLKRSYFRARAQTDEQLAKGVPELKSSIFPDGSNAIPPSAPNQFLRLVEEWKPGNVDLLKSHYDWLEAGLLKLRNNKGSGYFAISSLCEETLIRRLWSKDETAMQDYEELFRSSFATGDVPMEVMAAVPDHPGMNQLAREAFLGENAPLGLTKPWTPYDSSRKNLIDTYGERSPLLVLPAFRQALLEALRTTSKQATLSVTKEGGALKYEAGNPDQTEPLNKDAALLCAADAMVDVRLCDLIAYYLTPKAGADVWVSPAFHLDDPQPDRDRAIGEWIRILSAPEPP